MAVINSAIVNIVMIDRLIFDCCHFSKMDGLQLMAIGQIGMVSGDNFIVMVIGFCCQDLMLGSSFKMMGSLAVMLGS